MPILLFTPENTASANIAKQMIELFGYKNVKKGIWENNGIKLIETSGDVLEVPTDFDTDCIIVLSTHKGMQGKPTLTAHVPGNWNDAQFGGEPRTLNIMHAVLLKYILLEMKKAGNEEKLDWEIAMEADHHGPTCDVPILFAEIGSTEKEWANETAAKVVATAVQKAILRLQSSVLDSEGKCRCPKSQDSKPKTEFKTRDSGLKTIIGFGGGHYCREFTKVMLEEDSTAVGHVAPKYTIDSIDADIFRQAIEKNVDKVDRILILKDGTNLEQKNKIKKLAEEFGLEAELI